MKHQIVLLLLSLPFFAFTQKERNIQPKKSVAKVTLVGKNEYPYFALSQKSTTAYEVVGPGILYLNVRVRLEEKETTSAPMTVKCYRSDNWVEALAIPSLTPSKLRFKNTKLSGSPTHYHRVAIEVPPGKYRYKLYKGSSQKTMVKARYKKFPKPVWVDLAPYKVLKQKEILFVKKNKKKKYHQLTSRQEGFIFATQDSMSLRLIIRPEFNYKMLSETQIKIKVKNETTGEEQIDIMSGRKSRHTEFVHDKKHSPGESKTLYINLRKPTLGKEHYSISLVGGPKNAVIRVSKDSNLTALL